MRDNFPASLKEVLRHEGGYSDHAQDAGGKTMRGVTQATYDGFRRLKGLVPRAVRYLTDAEHTEIYKVMYWDKVCGDQLPKGIDFAVFDAAVNSGPGRAEKWLQQAINKVAGQRRLKEDGQVGFATIDAADDYPARAIIEAMIDLRLGFMRVAKNTRTGALLWPVFGGGWSNRLLGYLPKGEKVRRPDGVLQVASAMAAKNVEPREVVKPALPPVTPQPTPILQSSLGFKVAAGLGALAALAFAAYGG